MCLSCSRVSGTLATALRQSGLYVNSVRSVFLSYLSAVNTHGFINNPSCKLRIKFQDVYFYARDSNICINAVL